jgi:AbrB family looped-hinge helix DNA binding protein
MEYRRILSKGELVIPVKIRKKLNIEPGTRIYISDDNGKILLEPITSGTIRKNIGILGTKGKLLKAFQKEKKAEKKL